MADSLRKGESIPDPWWNLWGSGIFYVQYSLMGMAMMKMMGPGLRSKLQGLDRKSFLIESPAMEAERGVPVSSMGTPWRMATFTRVEASSTKKTASASSAP